MRTSSLKFLALFALTSAVGAAEATEYTWNGNDSGDWATATNWVDGDGNNGVPGSSDTATFNGDASVTISKGTDVDGLTIADGKRVQIGSSTSYQKLQVGNYTSGSSSTLALANVIILPIADSSALELTGQIEIVAGTKNGIYGNGTKNTGCGVTISGNLIGSGEVYFRNNSTGSSYSRQGVTLSGDNSGFSGTAYVLSNSGTDMLGTKGQYTTFNWNSDDCGATNAHWVVSAGDTNIKLSKADGYFKFGEMTGSGTVGMAKSCAQTVELGHMGTDFTCGINFTRTSGGVSANITKVGKGVMTFTGSIYAGSSSGGVLTLKDGVTVIAKSTNPNSIVFDGGALGIVEDDGYDPVAKFASTSPAAVIIDDQGHDNTWSGGITDTCCPNGFTKRGAGSLTLTTAFNLSKAVKVEAGMLKVAAGTTIADLTVSSGAKLGLYSVTAYTEATEVLTLTKVNLAAGQTLASIMPSTTTITYTFETNEETGAVTVKAMRAPLLFTWTGDEDTDWQNAANWSVNNQEVTEVPTPVDTVLFPARSEGSWSVEVSADAHIIGMTNNAPVTLSGSGDLYLGSISSELEEAPALTLGDGTMIRSENARSAVLKIDVPLNITASAENPAKVYGRWMKDSGGNSQLYINRELLGSGAVEIGQSRGEIFFNGTNTAFAGSIKILDDSSSTVSGALRTAPQIVLPEATSSNAAWTVYNSGSLLRDGGKTYYFGALSGSVDLNDTQVNYQKNTLEIGARGDVASVLGGNFFANSYVSLAGDRGNTIRKVGAGTLTTTAVRVRAYEINDGLLVLNSNRAVHTRWNNSNDEVTDETAEATSCYNIPITFKGGTLALGDDVTADPSTNIVNSTGPIAFSNATACTWSSVLATSNKGGLTKKGDGTLTLTSTTGDKPSLGYKGYTRVEAGKLAIASGTHYQWDLTSPVTIANGVEGAAPTSFGIGTVDTVWTYGTDSYSDTKNTVEIDNLTGVDVSAYEGTVSATTKIVLMTAKQYRVNSVVVTSLPDVTINWGSVEHPTDVTWLVQVKGNDLVVAQKPQPLIIIVR